MFSCQRWMARVSVAAVLHVQQIAAAVPRAWRHRHPRHEIWSRKQSQNVRTIVVIRLN